MFNCFPFVKVFVMHFSHNQLIVNGEGSLVESLSDVCVVLEILHSILFGAEFRDFSLNDFLVQLNVK